MCVKESALAVNRFYYNDLQWCSCGDPLATMNLLRDVLDAIRWNFEEGREEKYEVFTGKIESLLGKIGSPLCLTYFYVLDAADLTEHGGGLVNGGWLTDKGRYILGHLKHVGDFDWNHDEETAIKAGLENK